MKTNYVSGHTAEKQAAEHLKRLGFKIKELNWKTRFCEIDIVAQQAKTIHFMEVKYRLNDKQGSGLDYITPYKLKQMRFAADMWVQDSNWLGDYCLGAIEVSGPEFRVTNFIANLS